MAETTPMLTWTTGRPSRAWLRAEGFAVITFADLRERFIAPARAVGVQRATLASPVAPLLDRFAQHPRVAVLDVSLRNPEDLRDLHGYAMEPAWRAGCRLVVHADRTLDELDPDLMSEAWFEHAWTFERARHLARVMVTAGAPPARPAPPQPRRQLDPEQIAAVGARGGVVQVIAPAGSGKTTVLVERVRELLRRGAPPERIACITFNTGAAKELRRRLAEAGVPSSVRARTFHGTGRLILEEVGSLRGEPRGLTVGQWRRLSALAMRGDGVWIEPPEARALVSGLKLGRLLTPPEWRRIAPADPESQTLGRLYALYEGELRADGNHDFDDHILLSVRALRDDAALRRRWQARFEHVLVDEYQDIEPAQELLVQILAAPQDSLFTVGDEDQVLYGWRRASAGRIVGLDQVYPGLERIALATNYRCPVDVVERSGQLIAANAVRFPKVIRAAPGRSRTPDAVEVVAQASAEAAAAWTAAHMAGRERGQVVVLARTTRLLGTVAWACVGPGVRIQAPPAVFEAKGAQAVLEAHLRLAADPEGAAPDDVLKVLRNPSRGLPLDAEGAVAERLGGGASWAEALRGLGPDPRGRLVEAAAVLDRLRATDDALAFVRRLRGAGGLDEHFAVHERVFGATEQVELEQLEDAERAARGATVGEFALRLRTRRESLLGIRDDEHGIELTTIHRAKGREWPTVIVFGVEAGQLPHSRALDVGPEQVAAGEGLEAERRVAYVALTRAQEHLHVLTTAGSESPFLWEAGMIEAPAPAPPARDGRPSLRRAPAPPAGPLGKSIGEITRVGAGYAVRNSPSRAVGLRVAAWAIRHNLVTAENAGARVTVAAYVGEVPDLRAPDAAGAIERAGAEAGELVRRLRAEPRRALADELDRLARSP